MPPPSNNRLILKIAFAVFFLVLIGELVYIVMTVNKKSIFLFKNPISVQSKKSKTSNTNRPWPFDQTTTIKSTFLAKENLFLHTFLGTFIKMKLDKNLIYLQGLDKKTYTFLIPNLVDRDKKGIKVINLILQQSNKKQNLLFTFFYEENTNGPTFSKTDFVNIEWIDERNESQLIELFDKDPNTPLNFHSPIVSSFTVLRE